MSTRPHVSLPAGRQSCVRGLEERSVQPEHFTRRMDVKFCSWINICSVAAVYFSFSPFCVALNRCFYAYTRHTRTDMDEGLQPVNERKKSLSQC